MSNSKGRGSAALRIGLIAAASMSAAQASAQSFPFESGNLSGWLQGGTAFRNQPTLGNNIAPRLPGASPGHDGDYWIGSFESRPNAATPLGTIQGDEPTGALISPLFTIRDNSLTLLVGGGSDAVREHVDLLVELAPGDRGGGPSTGLGSVVNVPEGRFRVEATATGNNSETMRLVAWDTRPMIGRRARIMIVDDSSGPWGHINVDDIRPSNRVVAAAVTGAPPVATPVGPGSIHIHVPGGQMTGPPVAQPVGGGTVVVTPAPGPVVATPVPGPGPAPGAASGRFRLVATGFVVERQSYDTITENDGRGDEVFVRGDSFTFDHRGTMRRNPSVQSTLFGQLGRYGGGSAQPGAFDANRDPGGFVTGDQYPAGGAWTEPSRRRPDDLPMVLWEGTLTEGFDAAVIIPTIWEFDSASATREEMRWGSGLAPAVEREAPRVTDLIRAWPADQRRPIIDDMVSLFLTNEGNRPIGSARQPGGFPLPGQPIGRVLPMQLDPIVLTYHSAMMQLGRQELFDPRDEEGVTVFDNEVRLPRGAFAIPFIDGNDMQGHYLLFVRIEQLP